MPFHIHEIIISGTWQLAITIAVVVSYDCSEKKSGGFRNVCSSHDIYVFLMGISYLWTFLIISFRMSEVKSYDQAVLCSELNKCSINIHLVEFTFFRGGFRAVKTKASVSVNFQSRTYELLEVLKAERALMQGIGYKGVGRVKGVNGVGVTQRQGNCGYSRGTGCWLDIRKLLPPRGWSSQSHTYCWYYLDHHYHGYSTKRMASTFLLPSNLSWLPSVIGTQPELSCQGNLGNVVCRLPTLVVTGKVSVKLKVHRHLG